MLSLIVSHSLNMIIDLYISVYNILYDKERGKWKYQLNICEHTQKHILNKIGQKHSYQLQSSTTGHVTLSVT